VNNLEIKQLIRDSRFFNYEIAEALGISENTLSRWFRKPLSQVQIDRIKKAIHSLKGAS
jgi:predicted XRE-type DNA-binding protein